MKKFFGLKTKLSILIIMIVASLLISTSAFAAGALLTKTVSASFTVVAKVPNLEFYSDEACTTPLTSINFGTHLHQGDTSSPVSIWVKNTGEVDFTAVNVTTTLSSIQGAITFTPGSFPLTQGGVSKVDLSLTVGTAATIALTSATITFNAT